MEFTKEELQIIISALERQAMGVMETVTDYALKGMSDASIAIACRERVQNNYAIIKRIEKELRTQSKE
jgi:hypothetical protein